MQLLVQDRDHLREALAVQLHGQDNCQWLQHKKFSPAYTFLLPEGKQFAYSEAKMVMQMYSSLASSCMSTVLP